MEGPDLKSTWQRARPVDRETVSEGSRAFYDALVDQNPAWAERIRVLEGRGETGLFAWFPSPADEALDAAVWDVGDEPSLGFGRWHTHASVWNSEEDPAHAIAELLAAVLNEEIALVVEAGTEWDSIVDLRVEDEVEEALTSPYARGEITIRTFQGELVEPL
ncbi:MAG: hypothetical protein AAF411_18535 [Myxococcota bacterium]